MEQFLKNLRFGLRMMMRNPSFTLIAVLALAIGIGANTAIFTVVDGIVLKPLPYKDPQRLVYLWEKHPQIDNMSVAYPNFKDWRSQQSSFQSVAATQGDSFILTGVDQPERVRGANVSYELFDVLGIKTVLGRMFTAEEDRPGSNLAVISYGFWERRFGKDPDVLGKQLRLSGDLFTIIGVAQKGFSYPIGLTASEIWTPIGRISDRPNISDRGNHPGIYVVARLKDNVTLPQAQKDLERIAVNLQKAYPLTNKTNTIGSDSLISQVVGDLQTAGFVVLGAVAFVLLIACANVANLLLARATTRGHEMAVRVALGAGRGQIVGQLLTESLLLSAFSGVIGLLFAYWGVDMLRNMIPVGTPRADQIGIDGRVLGFTFLISILTGGLFGLVPALHAAKENLHETVKEGGKRATGSESRQRWRNALIVAEVALSVVLLVGAGLMMQSFLAITATSPGLNAANVSVATLALRGENYREPQQFRTFAQRLVEQITQTPGVQNSALTTFVPFVSSNQTGIYLEGHPRATPEDRILCDWSRITPNYFQTLGIRIVEGRPFDEHDNQNGRPVAIIDETMAKKYYPGGSAIGKRIYFGSSTSLKEAEIVAISAHVKHYGVDQPSRYEAYIPLYQDPVPTFSIVTKTGLDPVAIEGPLRAAVSAVDRDVPLYNQASMDYYVALAMTTSRLSTFMFAVFAAVALSLSAIGIYGVISYSVSQRTQEIGIRIALGAGAKDVLKLVFGQGSLLICAGVLLGVFGAVALTRVLSALLFQVSATDPATFVGAPLLLAAVAVLATLVPARRAMRVDPIQALRYE